MKSIHVFIILFILSLVFPWAVFGGQNCSVIQLAETDVQPPMVNEKGQVVWMQMIGTDYEIFFYDGSTVHRLTDNNYHDMLPKINAKGQIVWYSYENPSSEIYLFDGNGIRRLTNDAEEDYHPSINSAGHVVWMKMHKPWVGWDTTNYDIYFYDGSSIRQISMNKYADWSPQISDNDHLVWYGYDGADNEIFLYDGSTVRQLTNNFCRDFYPQVNAKGHVVWEGSNDCLDYEIFLYDGVSTRQLADNSSNEFNPALSEQGLVIWEGSGSGPGISLFDGSGVRQLANDSYNKHDPGVNSDGQAVWYGFDGTSSYYKVYYYDGQSVQALNGAPYTNAYPSIASNGYVAWWGSDNVSTKIYLAHCSDQNKNNQPVANAGPDQTVACGGPQGTSIALDGSQSSDPDGDALTYTWSGPFGSVTGATPVVHVPIGSHFITLTVEDGKGSSSSDTVTIAVEDRVPPATTLVSTAGISGSNGWYRSDVTVTLQSTDECSGIKYLIVDQGGESLGVPNVTLTFPAAGDGEHLLTYYAIDNSGNKETGHTLSIKIDKTPPDIQLSASPGVLWPPNHRMVDVMVRSGATDVVSGIADVNVIVQDEYGEIQPSVRGRQAVLALEAWRDGNDLEGRNYTITAVATDAAGNEAYGTTIVVVPHDRR